MTQSQQAFLDEYKNIQHAKEFAEDVRYVGQIDKVYPGLQDESYYTEIWENNDGQRIAVTDQGNGFVSYVGDGSKEGLRNHFYAMHNQKQEEIAEAGHHVYFPYPLPELAKFPGIHDVTYVVKTSTKNGITLHSDETNDHVFPHATYYKIG